MMCEPVVCMAEKALSPELAPADAETKMISGYFAWMMLSISRAILAVYSTLTFCCKRTVAPIRPLSEGGKNSNGTLVSNSSDDKKTTSTMPNVTERWDSTVRNALAYALSSHVNALSIGL